jgi:hypothetical protein
MSVAGTASYRIKAKSRIASLRQIAQGLIHVNQGLHLEFMKDVGLIVTYVCTKLNAAALLPLCWRSESYPVEEILGE